MGGTAAPHCRAHQARAREGWERAVAVPPAGLAAALPATGVSSRARPVPLTVPCTCPARPACLPACRGASESKKYNRGLRRHTLELAVLGSLERPPAGFETVIRCAL